MDGATTLLVGFLKSLYSAGLSQTSIGERTKVPPVTISAIMRGQQKRHFPGTFRLIASGMPDEWARYVRDNPDEHEAALVDFGWLLFDEKRWRQFKRKFPPGDASPGTRRAG